MVPGSFISSLQSLDFPECELEVLLGNFDPDSYSPLVFEQLGIVMPRALSQAVPKRQAEFLAGRYLARNLLSEINATSLMVGIGHHREPLWPEGIIGSISHHDRLAACVIGHETHAQAGIGLDIEQTVTTDVAASMVGIVVNEQELEKLKALPFDEHWLLTSIFSAKESIFKALYPQVQAYFDFLDVALVSFEQGSLWFELRRELSPGLPKGRRGRVDYQTLDKSVVTLTKSEFFLDNSSHY
ncbi:4'-phosphopantetheinyl transferase family protein [Photobacterium atrarenae]|uniref:Enterobactin synthase component D n=1 Tax=Photobacterium atrarenae TaxID=865757 RepID=A0ABY5GDB3_9GAMM|nr:4'-phosphopantetheinyl transferase superfamily protein [Photobacterium atrarenae]UTV27195.1 4'-phosphopantetheinyl transferase superfamily protein [Photobacterium atrarenae]